MMHSLSNKLLFHFMFFLNKTNKHKKKHFKWGKKCFTGIYHLNKYKDIEVLLDPVLHTMAMELQMHTLYPCQNSHIHTHRRTHILICTNPVILYCPYCTNTIFPACLCGTHTHIQRLNKQPYKL